MADCAACGTRLEEGLTKCPQCGAVLHLPGSFMQTFGWVILGVSLIPIVVGIVCLPQNYYLPIAFGIGLVVLGILLITTGRVKARSVPAPTKPSAGPMTGTPPLAR